MADPIYCPDCNEEIGTGHEKNDCMCCAGYLDGAAAERARICQWLRQDWASKGNVPFPNMLAALLEQRPTAETKGGGG